MGSRSWAAARVNCRTVIPGASKDTNPESRDSGFALRAPRNDGKDLAMTERVAQSCRCAKAHQRARRVVIELAGLAPLRRTHRHDEFGDLLGRLQRHRIF